MNDLTTLLLIAVISLGIGLAIGGLVANAMSARTKSDPAESAPAEVRPDSGRIFRDPDGGIVLELNGKQYHKPQDLDAGARVFVEQYLGTLLTWVKPAETSQAATPGAASLAKESGASAGALKGPATATGPETAAINQTSAESLKQSYNPLDVFARALRTDTHKSSPASTSIASQIDEILQEKLAGLPDEKRAIRLMELPGKGMVVMVGLDHYDGVEAVPDPDVRALIRECVQEWERKMSGQD